MESVKKVYSKTEEEEALKKSLELYPVQQYIVESIENWDDDCEQRLLHPIKIYNVEATENWDNCDEPTYHPLENIKNRRILIPVNANNIQMEPKEKKEFYMNQRRKWKSSSEKST